MIFTPTRVGKGISPTHVLEVSAVYRPMKLYAFRMYAWHQGHHVVTDYVSARDLGHAQRLATYVVRTLVRDVVHPSQFDDSSVTWKVVPLGPSTPVAQTSWCSGRDRRSQRRSGDGGATGHCPRAGDVSAP